MRQLLSRIQAFFGVRAMDRDFDQELESHLAMMAEDYERRGMTPREARRAAALHFGGVAQLREAHRATRGLQFLDGFLQDARYALRALRKNPGFTALAVLTLAIGIGVNTAAFTLFDAAALRPLPVADPERLMQLAHEGRDPSFSYPEYSYYRNRSRAFSAVSALMQSKLSMSGVSAVATSRDGVAGTVGLQFPRVLGKSEPVTAFVVSGNYFQVLGAAPAIGRAFLPEEDSAGALPVALLSDNFWERRFSRDPAILGRRLTLNGMSVTIVGITPRDFGGTVVVVPDLWVPFAVYAQVDPSRRLLQDDASHCCRVYGRLSPGIAQGQARQEWNTLAVGRPVSASDNGRRDPARPARFVVGKISLTGQPGDAAEPAQVIVLLGSVGLVLLIACANVASLLLARSASRQREIAIRLAIGASRWRLVRQLLTENAVMSLLAGAAGMVFSGWTVRFLQMVANSALTGTGALALNLTPDHRVFGYMLFLAVAATLGFGLAPALESSRPNLTSGLRDEGAAFGGKLRKSRLRDLMVGAQVAVCLVLLIAAGLMARASARALSVDLGFDYRNVVSLDLEFPPAESTVQIAATRAELVLELARLPEVQRLAVASRMPLVHGGMLRFAVSPNGGPVDVPGTPEAWYTLVTSSYFDTLGIPIVRGRNFTAQEARDGHNYDGSPVIVSETTAQQFWPGENPIGKRISFGAHREPGRLSDEAEQARSVSSSVIGVARDVRGWRLDRVDPTNVYLPIANSFGGSGMAVIAMRARGNEGRVVAAVRRILQTAHPDLQAAIGDSRTAVTTQSAFIGSRLGSLAAALIGILGLLMTSVGIYGTVGFAVTQRTQEIGIRMALGARRSDVLGMVLRETMRPVAIGLAIGFAGAAAASRLMHSFLLGLSSLDPIAFLGVSAFLAAVALLAGYVPARRAAKVDPMIALRYE